ncbi:MAG: FKBP-type peptidyl-prolyl cis-trans isomerase [Paludibacter sp.]|nr:FKBP-type peptidyl-prolyl cis-trans isomerase [Paludibacter sp.]
MKRTSIIFLITFLLLIIMSACKENEWIDWKLMNDKWYAAHKNDPGFITTKSGLCYKVIYAGWPYNRQPNANSVVVVSYKGSLIDGSVFDSVPKDSSISLYLSNTIPAWKEILPKMYSGSDYLLYVPSNLGYDNSTTNVLIPPHSVLIFDVKLVDSFN